MQGGAAKGLALTAYTLTAFLENEVSYCGYKSNVIFQLLFVQVANKSSGTVTIQY